MEKSMKFNTYEIHMSVRNIMIERDRWYEHEEYVGHVPNICESEMFTNRSWLLKKTDSSYIHDRQYTL